MNATMNIEDVAALRGEPVYDSAGEKIGEVEEIFYDEETGRPEWIGIGTGFFGTKRVLVPLTGARADSEGLTVPYDRQQVKDSPDVDSDELTQELEVQLSSYYGLAGADEDLSLSRDEAAVVRSEEELAVGKREVESGRVRIRKWVETEPVQVEVELKREKARVVREPLDERTAGEIRDTGAQEEEVVLREERPVVSKETVAKERIGVETDVETERRTIEDDVRKERVEVDEDAR